MNRNIKEKIRFANKELIENDNLAIISEIFTNNYVAHNKGRNHKGHEFIKRWIKQLRLSIPDVRVVKVDFYVQSENIVVWQRFLKGTHKVKMKGIPPSGKKIKWVEMVISRLDGEKIAEDWVVSELLGELLLKTPLPSK